MTKDWHPRLRTVIENSLPDAIHTMSPAGGVGADTALRDAAALAEALGRAASGAPLIPELRTYEADMTAYGYDAVRESARGGAERYHQNPLPVI